MNMRNAACMRSQTSKVVTRVANLFVSYSVTQAGNTSLSSCGGKIWPREYYSLLHCPLQLHILKESGTIFFIGYIKIQLDFNIRHTC